MKQFFFLILCLVFAQCASVRFVGDPVVVNPNTPISIPLTSDMKNEWARYDLVEDSVPGMSVNKAFTDLIKDQKGERVIVAIVDTGMDVQHPAIASKIWINEDEVPGNGIDDDQNGYVDDIHGWNFLGESQNENFEYVRLQKREDLDSDAFAVFEEKRNKELQKYRRGLANLLFVKEELPNARAALQQALNTKAIDLFAARALSPMTVELSEAILIEEYAQKTGLTEITLQKAIEQYQDALQYHHNLDFEGRSVVGDDPDNYNDRGYGDPLVQGPDGSNNDHATHVAGLVGGLDVGVATSVKIMPIRALPNGDEYDKDVALAIRYAVDNGAKIINASFGKSYSPHQDWVHDAIRYAAEKDVLIVHAAGNDDGNIDPGGSLNFPNDMVGNKEISDNLITVGASHWEYNEQQIARFSNYGAVNVDVFAPGHKIYSSVPNQQYEQLDGTSMASPLVAGVAAVLWSHYPKYSAKKIKRIILKSGLPMFSSLSMPSETDQQKPNYYSKTGKLVNLYNALLYASKRL